MSNDNEQFNDDLKVTPEQELEALKTRADLLKVAYHPSIGLEKLRDKVNAAISAEPGESSDDEPVVEQTAPTAPKEETIAQRRERKKKEANELVRIRVTCMNPAKKEWEGEIFTAGNSLVGSFKKYVPFNSDEGWHVPRIIFNQLKDRQCQVFVNNRDARGNVTRKGKLIKEFAIEVMPNLTIEELHDLAQRQALSGSVAQA